MKKTWCLLGLAIVCISTYASANADGGVNVGRVIKPKEYRAYVRAGVGFPVYRCVGGGHFHSRPKFRISGNVAVGFKINQKLTMELEGIYMKFSSKHVDFTRPRVTSSQMNYTTWGGFINGLFNFSKFYHHKLSPYVGVGIGIPLYSKQVFLHRKPITYKSLSIPGLTSLEIESIIFCICLIMLLILRNFSLISQNISIIKCGQTFLTKKTGAFNIAYH